MTAKQSRQLQAVEEIVSAMVAELSPRVIQPSEEKQAELGIAEETMLVPVGNRRAITLNATLDGGWSIKEFDTSAGTLVPVASEEIAFGGDRIIEAVLAATITSLQAQLAASGTDAVPADERGQLTAVFKLLQSRHATLLADGLESFEFEPVDM
jgi:hypothetical protein